jgi:hypothetical protein
LFVLAIVKVSGSPEQTKGGKVTMSHSQDVLLEALKQASIALRNMEVETEGHTLSVGYARTYTDHLAYIAKVADKMNALCVSALLGDATRTLMEHGYEVKVAPKKDSDRDINDAMSLLVRNGYKVTDSQGRNY